MNATADLQSVMKRHIHSYCQGNRLSTRERQVCSHVRSCRTEALGGRMMGCEQCDYTCAQYYACRDRHCPKCQHRQREAWCERQRASVIPVTYHHLVFTLPSDLNAWVGLHPEILYHQLFTCAWETLSRFGADPKRLNGQLGMIAVLHTWGENLARHVHLHCLVPGGALSEQGNWKSSTSTYLFPVRALSRCFRGQMVSALREAAENDQLARVTNAGEVDALLDTLMSKEWVVFSKPCPNRTGSVIDYLGRYSHRIAISDQRIVAVDEKKVHFSYKDYRDQSRRSTLSLDAGEFIRRYLLHVLPKGFKRIRHYGWLASSCRKKKLLQIRRCLLMNNEALNRQEAGKEMQAVPEGLEIRCPNCREGKLSPTGGLTALRAIGGKRLSEG